MSSSSAPARELQLTPSTVPSPSTISSKQSSRTDRQQPPPSIDYSCHRLQQSCRAASNNKLQEVRKKETKAGKIINHATSPIRSSICIIYHISRSCHISISRHISISCHVICHIILHCTSSGQKFFYPLKIIIPCMFLHLLTKI